MRLSKPVSSISQLHHFEQFLRKFSRQSHQLMSSLVVGPHCYHNWGIVVSRRPCRGPFIFILAVVLLSNTYLQLLIWDIFQLGDRELLYYSIFYCQRYSNSQKMCVCGDYLYKPNMNGRIKRRWESTAKILREKEL